LLMMSGWSAHVRGSMADGWTLRYPYCWSYDAGIIAKKYEEGKMCLDSRGGGKRRKRALALTLELWNR
jgi:hypothetical protein